MSFQQHKLFPLFIWTFVIMMFAFCFFIAWQTSVECTLRFQVADVSLSLDTSRQREAKQQYEYDEVVASIPETKAQLDLLQPQADAMAAKVVELKATRKELRAKAEELETQLTDAQTAQAQTQIELSLVQLETEALKAEIATLQVQLDALTNQRTDSRK